MGFWEAAGSGGHHVRMISEGQQLTAKLTVLQSHRHNEMLCDKLTALENKTLVCDINLKRKQLWLL